MMGVIAKYKFNQTIYENFIPEFNSEFTDYTITDEIDTDGYTIRTIESDSLPTLMRFGQLYNAENDSATPKSLSLLEIYEMDLSTAISINDMFRKCENLTAIHCQFNCNFDIVTDTQEAFRNCFSLISLDVSNFSTENVTNMSNMFSNCSSLTSLDVSNFNTEKVTNMYQMFQNCSSLTSLDVSNFNTENVTNMNAMFNNCSSLTSLDVSNFNTQNVTTMNYIFQNCSSLTSLDVSNFNTENVTDISGIFSGCSSLTSLDVSNFKTENVKNMSWMFYNCSSLTSLDVSNFNTENVTNTQGMFQNCRSLTSLDISNFKTENVTGMYQMFSNCSSLTSLDVSNFNTEKVTSMQNMFNGCSSLTSLDISSFNIKNTTSTENMFQNCYDLTNVGVIYCDADTVNKISDLITTDTTIWYSDAKLEDLTEKENITYKEYKMNILESDEEIVLCRIGDVYDELNLETGELTQRIGEVVLDGSENWGLNKPLGDGSFNQFIADMVQAKKVVEQSVICDKLIGIPNQSINNTIWIYNGRLIVIHSSCASANELKSWLQSNPITVQYELETESVKTVDLKNKPSINWQGDDIYLHLENNTLYPQLDCEIESINYYEIPKLKANTLYTLRYVGESTQCILGGLTYKAENNMVLTSGSSDNLLYFDKEVRKVVLIEGDVRDRNFDYFEGIESLGAVEIVVHKSDMPIFAKGGRK